MHTELTSTLAENHIISEESKEKVCIITDIVKLYKLMGQPAPTVEEFDHMYDGTILELQALEQRVLKERNDQVWSAMVNSQTSNL